MRGDLTSVLTYFGCIVRPLVGWCLAKDEGPECWRHTVWSVARWTKEVGVAGLNQACVGTVVQEADDEAVALLRLVRALGACADFAAAAATLCTELAAMLRADRVILGWRGQRACPTRPVALSGAGLPEWDAETLRGLMAVLDEAVDQSASLVYPAGDGPARIVRAHQVWCRQHALSAAVTVPLALQGQVLGAVLAEFEHAASTDVLTRLERALALTTPWLWLLRTRHESHLTRLLRHWRRLTMRWRVVALAAASVLLVVLGLPRAVSVSAPARLEGEWQRPVVAPIRGYIKSVAVLPGDEVQQDQVLAELGDRDLELEHARLSSEVAQYAAAVRQSMVRGDRAAMAIDQARHDEAAASLGLIEHQLEQIRVRAPVAGVVIAGDLAQKIGAPVDRGSELFVVAPRQRYRVLIELDERDLAQVMPGQQGRVSLSALPWSSVDVQVTRIAPAATVVDGRHVFEVQAQLIQPLDGMRPGQRGVAHVQIGRAPLLVHGLRRAADAMARLVWRWRP